MGALGLTHRAGPGHISGKALKWDFSITETEAKPANDRKGRRNTGKSAHFSSAQGSRQCRSITLSLFWGKGQTWFARQLDSCKLPFQEQFGV